MSISLTGPILEKWLLSGKAIHKNLSLGGAGLVQIPVPEGKTFIITGIELLPFNNIITSDALYAFNNTFERPTAQNLTDILKRLQFQLLFYGLRTNSVYNIRNKLVLNNVLDTNLDEYIAPGLSFEKHNFECFHVVEENSWLFLKYWDFDSSATEVTTDFYQLGLDGTQNWPPSPQYGYFDQSDITGYAPPAAPNGFNYLTQGFQQFNSPDTTNQFIMNSIPFAEPGVNQATSFKPPFGNQSLINLSANVVPSIPWYNISVIEINRRLSTEGLI